MTRLGILGAGHFGGYLLEGLLRETDPPRVLLSPRGQSAALAARFDCAVAASNAALVEDSDVVLLAVRPPAAPAAVAGLPWRRDHVLVSVCGAVPLAALDAGHATKVRAMAAASVALGESTVLLWPEDARARAVLARLGPVIAVPDEEALDAGTAMYGYYAMLFGLMAEGERWIERQGYTPEDARTIVGLAFRGAGGMRLRDKATAPEAILSSLATPGGLTERGLASLSQDGALGAWSRALDAILRRIKATTRP